MGRATQPKYYVVWRGRTPGIYSSWAECHKQVSGFAGAQYRSYPTMEQARAAFSQPFRPMAKAAVQPGPTGAGSGPLYPSLAVDAACNMRTGVMEYRGVDAATRRVIFAAGPFKATTNNVGEFLALVHALALLNGSTDTTLHTMPIYSDSKTAMAWVRNRHANTTMRPTPENATLRELIARAEKWLDAHRWKNPILKWETRQWGEIPADYGRK